MAASQADGANGAGKVLTQDKLPTESAVHMPNEAPKEITVAERDCTSGHNSNKGSILDVPSEAPADTYIESEAIDEKATTQGLALATNYEAPLDPQHEEAIKPRLDNRPRIRAGEVEEGTNPGSPPIMLPNYARYAAAIIYIFITQHSKNGELTQDRDPATGKPLVVVLCNSNSLEDARDAERGEIKDTTNETITVWRTKQTYRPSN
ncbi:hypothetical protein BU23DRAFT_556442 [Bimuria novae-zelandiae CBS 107.79]|uniref:Uncharacterized protein n=1 Tax=Bimuria novae-zelandiae CBS 107.79 TaxID=1447943 RepID=A0A6A5VCH8_9PLEO|nr:hypothetical protein BU23DRAFT_556442 [Bimuria novae-zelandiae CBS 107.79]